MTRPCASLLLFALFTAALSAPALTIWELPPGETPPAPAPLAPAPVSLPFKNVRYAHLDDAQNVTFIADDPGYNDAGAHHGIYRAFAADGRIQCLVSPDDLIPGEKERKLDWLRGLQVDERGVDFIFNATAMKNPEVRGLFHWSGGKLAAIVRVGVTVLPGDSGPVTNVHWGAINGGRVLYTAEDSAKRLALVLHDLKTGADRVLVRAGDPIPGHPGEKFHDIDHQNWLDASSIVFGGAAADPDADSNGSTAKGGPDGIYGWFHLGWDDPAALAPGRLVTVADVDTPLPGPDQGRFDSFLSAPVNGGIVVFNGTGEGGQGMYLAVDGRLRSVVDTDTEIGGPFARKFTGFTSWPAALANGAVFAAKANGFVGVFLYRADQDALYLLADNDAPLDGKKIRDFEVGSHPLAGQCFAVAVKFDDGSSGIYRGAVPAQAYHRQQAAPAPGQ